MIDTAKQQQRFIDALVSADGNVSAACKRVGIARATFYNWRDTNTEFAERVDDVREKILDELEQSLRDIARDRTDADSFKALRLILEARGRGRGYGVRAADVTTGGQALPPCKIVWIESGEQIPDDYDY